jgi:tRNA (guanine6-N2)-methyltransferase
VPARLLARCVHGLEWVCADEIGRLPAAGRIRFARREVTFAVPSLDSSLLALPTADDVFLLVGTAAATAPEAIAEVVRDLAWTDRTDDVRGLREVPAAPALDVVAVVEGHRFGRFAVEHAVGPALAARLGGSYLRRTAAGREPGEPDLTVRVAVRDGQVTAAVRLGARPLHRRHWKHDTGPGTLHPPLAAALARLAAPSVGRVLDPFCGDGTIAVETALAYPGATVVGRDLDATRLANAARNAERAGVAPALERADAGAAVPGTFDAVVTNPPWNLAVDAAGTLRRGLGPFWRRLPALLGPEGRFVAVADAGLDAPSALVAEGCVLGVVATVRLSGRISHVVLASRGRRPEPTGRLGAWRARAIAAGVVTAEGF